MEEENEVLDWEDDEEQTQAPTAEDDADGVSLGSGSDDENEARSQLAAVDEPGNLPVTVSGQRDSSGVTRQATVPPPVSQSERHVHTEDSTKPHSSSLHRKDPENNGLSDSNASPAPKGSRRRSKKAREPPTSTLPKVHGLPPKPVASTLAFVAPSHPSLTEATAMSQSKGKNGLSSVPSGNSSSKATGDQRPHSSGSNNKPLSSKANSGEIPLPPDWQLRQSRSSDAVYYYNTRTHECTWVKPLPELPDSSKERNALTFEDRHYRPGVVDDTTSSTRQRTVSLEPQVSSSTRNDRGPPPKDTWFGRSGFHEEEDGDSDDSYRGHSARDRRGRRSPSPASPNRSRDVDTDVRGTRHSQSQRRHDRVSRAAAGDRENEYNNRTHEPEHNRSGAEEFRIHDSDRHWAPRDEPHSHSRPGYDQAPDAHKLQAKSSRRHPPASPQEFLPQAHGHRQHDRAEPYSHEQSREERKRNAYPPITSRSRDIDSWEQRQPQNSLSSTNRHRSPSPPHPMLMTTSGLPPPPLAATNSATLISSVSTSTSGRRNKPSRFAPASSASVPEDVDDWVPDEFRTEAANESRAQDTERARERTREPEREIREPKSDHFLDERRRPERARSTAPASPDIPASRPKRQPLPSQSMEFREKTSGGDAMQRDPPPHRDRGRSSKFGPPLITPTASSITNTRTEIDSAITPSAPRAFDTLEPPPPSGPRGRSRSFDGDGSRTRGRAHPRRERSRGRSRSYSRSRSRSMEREREAERVKRGDSTVEVPKGPRAMEHSSVVDSGSHELQGRRPPHLPAVPLPPVAPANRGRGGKGRGRRGREQVTATGTNNIPVGTRGSNDTHAPAPPRYTSQHDSAPLSVPPKGLTGGNVIPLKNARTRGYGSKADEDIVEPLGSYSRSRSRTPPRRSRGSPVRRDERDTIESGRPSRPSKVRRESFSEVRYDTSSFTAGYEDPPPPGDRTTDSHRWGNRDLSPPSPSRYRQREVSERIVTPPHSSRVASRISPYQDEDRRLDRHHQRNADSMEDVRVSRDNENSRGRDENTIADNGQDSKQNGYKMQHPLPMNPMLLRIGPTTPVQPTGPSSPSTSYPRHRDRSPAPLPPPLVSSSHLPGSSQDSSESLPVTRQSKPPVKIRRPPPLAQEMSSFPNPLPQPAPMIVDEPDHSKPRRQSPRRGGSLLDRLSGGVGNIREDNMTPSLKDRVLVPSKRDRGELDEPVDSDRHDDYHNGNNGWDGADDGRRESSALPYESGGGKRRRPYRGGGSSRKSRKSNKMPA
ncbi:hypothetical protein L218DRAFT_1079270 [Marasmius fiardii PR-910]|nr:hypothetical protein L218DRAFT_1079270 [Marasmius fiardii PR-910]